MTQLLERSLLCCGLLLASASAGCDPSSPEREGCGPDGGSASAAADGGCEDEPARDPVQAAPDAAHGQSSAPDAAPDPSAAPDAADHAADASGSAAPDAGDASAADAARPDAAGASPDAGSGGGHGKLCGGFAGLDCNGGEFCNYEAAAGGQGCDGTISDASGVCQSLPQGCTDEYAPVCGCDGTTYGNACSAHAAGASVRSQGECSPGRVSCDERALLCRRVQPVCPTGQVPSIVGSCYGACVPLEHCSCNEAADCPLPDEYTCHLSAGHCGPYVD